MPARQPPGSRCRRPLGRGSAHGHTIPGGQAEPGPASRQVQVVVRQEVRAKPCNGSWQPWRHIAAWSAPCQRRHRPDGKDDFQRRPFWSLPPHNQWLADVEHSAANFRPRLMAGTQGALAAVSFLPRTATVKEDDTMSLRSAKARTFAERKATIPALVGLHATTLPPCDPLIVPADLHRPRRLLGRPEGRAAAVMPSSRSPLDAVLWNTPRPLETIHCRMDVLPVRYGVEMPTNGPCAICCGSGDQSCWRSLKRLKGTGEMGLRIELAVDEEPSCVAAAETVFASAASSPLGYLASAANSTSGKTAGS